MDLITGKILLELGKEVVFETLWPTRCALCDMPGELICTTCLLKLPFIDQLQCCANCGAPHGKLVCTECNSLSLAHHGWQEYPLRTCCSVFHANPDSIRLITTYKDRNERRLAHQLSTWLISIVPPRWHTSCFVTTIPTTQKARNRRGFDPLLPIAESFSQQTGIPYVPLLTANSYKQAKDQRKLQRQDRLENMRKAFSPTTKPILSRLIEDEGRNSVIILDDVYTTGATLCSAAELLKQAGFKTIYGITCVRV